MSRNGGTTSGEKRPYGLSLLRSKNTRRERHLCQANGPVSEPQERAHAPQRTVAEAMVRRRLAARSFNKDRLLRAIQPLDVIADIHRRYYKICQYLGRLNGVR
jgi:hypothetical protein